MVKVAARSSPLSRAQVAEVESLIGQQFTCTWVETTGDRDRTTSLRTLGTIDFFTREVDALVLDGTCDVAIHSAKDLPDPLAPGLSITAITEGIDPGDVLVLRPGETLQPGMRIATSSERREEAVKQLSQGLRDRTKITCTVLEGKIDSSSESFPSGVLKIPLSEKLSKSETFFSSGTVQFISERSLIFQDLRGTILERLAKLEQNEADGIVVAKAALIRLGLLDLNWIDLPGDTVPLQGQLAIVCRDTDRDSQQLFSSLDTGVRR